MLYNPEVGKLFHQTLVRSGEVTGSDRKEFCPIQIPLPLPSTAEGKDARCRGSEYCGFCFSVIVKLIRAGNRLKACAVCL